MKSVLFFALFVIGLASADPVPKWIHVDEAELADPLRKHKGPRHDTPVKAHKSSKGLSAILFFYCKSELDKMKNYSTYFPLNWLILSGGKGAVKISRYRGK